MALNQEIYSTPRDSGATITAPDEATETIDADATEVYNPATKDIDESTAKEASNKVAGDVPSQPQRIVISFEPGDPENPHNWPFGKKMAISTLAIVLTLNSTLSSSLTSGSIDYIVAHFHITNKIQPTLPISLFLIGYIIGPLIFGPMTEVGGRRPVLLSTFILFVGFTLGTALAPTWPALLVLRFFAGVSAATPLAACGAMFADIWGNPVARGRIMAMFSAGVTIGPALSPIISGFAARFIGWRWPFWIVFFFGCATLIPMLFYPETFAPILLARRAAAIRKRENRNDVFSPKDLESVSLKELFFVTLSRPVVMLYKEPIVIACSLYMAYIYAILYMFFESFPIIFQGVYGFKPGIIGLPYLAIGLGAIVSAGILISWDSYGMRKEARDPNFELTPEWRRLHLVGLGSFPLTIGLFWMGWTSRKSIHWMCPIVGALPAGVGITTAFTALLNYLSDTYGIYSAAALTAAATSRSLTGALLPLAAGTMYGNLGIGWANSLLGFITIVMMPIPYVFLKYAGKIKEKSTFCRSLSVLAHETEHESADKEDEKV